MGPVKLRWGSADGMAIRGRGVELHITQCSGGSDPSCKSDKPLEERSTA